MASQALRRASAVALALGALAFSITLASAASDGGDEPLAPDRPRDWRLPTADLYAVASHSDRVWAVGYWGTVLRSRDAGASWEHLETPTRETLFDVDFADANRGWAVGAHGVVLRTTDGGARWTRQTIPISDEFGGERPLDSHLLSVSAVSGEEAWAVGDYGLLLHVRDGEHWESVTLPEELYEDDEATDRILNAVHFVDARHGWVVGEFGTTLRTADGGSTWTARRTLVDTPADLYLYAVEALDDQRAATVGLAGAVLVTADGGAVWEPRPTGGTAPLFGIALRAEGVTVVGDRGEMFTSADGGHTWRDTERPRLFNWLSAVAQDEDGHLYAVGEKGVVLRSDDGGTRWRQLRGSAPLPLSGVTVPDPKGDTGPTRKIPVTAPGTGS